MGWQSQQPPRARLLPPVPGRQIKRQVPPEPAGGCGQPPCARARALPPALRRVCGAAGGGCTGAKRVSLAYPTRSRRPSLRRGRVTPAGTATARPGEGGSTHRTEARLGGRSLVTRLAPGIRVTLHNWGQGRSSAQLPCTRPGTAARQGQAAGQDPGAARRHGGSAAKAKKGQRPAPADPGGNAPLRALRGTTGCSAAGAASGAGSTSAAPSICAKKQLSVSQLRPLYDVPPRTFFLLGPAPPLGRAASYEGELQQTALVVAAGQMCWARALARGRRAGASSAASRAGRQGRSNTLLAPAPSTRV